MRLRKVLPGTSAGEAGPRVGDLLLTVDGQAAAEPGVDQLVRRFFRAGRYTLTCRWGDKEQQTTLTLRLLL